MRSGPGRASGRHYLVDPAEQVFQQRLLALQSFAIVAGVGVGDLSLKIIQIGTKYLPQGNGFERLQCELDHRVRVHR